MEKNIPQDQHLVPISVEEEMKASYLDYAMSVIVGRAIPDVRDGLKPVHRRVLYAMYDLKNTHEKSFKKSARVVGNVIGKYHPHGDSAVYDTIVRMAQDFSLRYPLIEGQGNFGSIDGDAPAAMRYTEVRMEKMAADLLSHIEKDTVDFVENYDGSLTEPSVLPTRIPQLLINGSSGIAVGMATNIPPHHLGEIMDALVALIENPKLTVENLLQYVQGPDFPTAGVIFAGEGLKKAYLTGRGSIRIQGKAHIEEIPKGKRQRIVIDELPYQVNKAKMIEKIAFLVRNKKIEGISDIRDESNRKGIRVVLEIKKNENTEVILNCLYRLTQLRESYGIIFLAIIGKRPKVFNLKEMLSAFIDHRKQIITRRTRFDLQKAQKKAHLLEGLQKALEHLNEVIQIIRKAPHAVEAKQKLIEAFSFSQAQAQAILEMRLQRLTALEREKISEELKETKKQMQRYREILSQETVLFQIMKQEFLESKEKYAEPRRTQILQKEAKSLEAEDLLSDEPTLVTLTRKGYVNRMDVQLFKQQKRGGRGIKGAETVSDDFVVSVFSTTILSHLLCFTNLGRLYWLKVYRIPEGKRTSKGKAIVNLISLSAHEKVCAILPVRTFSEDAFLVFATRKGVVKKTALKEFQHVRSNGIASIQIRSGDQLVSVKLSHGKQEVLLCTKMGKAIRFPETNIRSTGRQARGVCGMRLKKKDEIVAMEVLDAQEQETFLLTVSEKGFGKKTPITEFRTQSRGGMGILAMKVNEKTHPLVSALQVSAEDELVLILNQGLLSRISVQEVSTIGRVTQGVHLMRLRAHEKMVHVERIFEDHDS